MGSWLPAWNRSAQGLTTALVVQAPVVSGLKAAGTILPELVRMLMTTLH